MRRMGLFEGKQKLAELVERAALGERTGITKRGKLAAMIGPAQEEVDLKKVFARMDEIRKRSKKPKNVSVKDLIEEGRVRATSSWMLPWRSPGFWITPCQCMRWKCGRRCSGASATPARGPFS